MLEIFIKYLQVDGPQLFLHLRNVRVFIIPRGDTIEEMIDRSRFPSHPSPSWKGTPTEKNGLLIFLDRIKRKKRKDERPIRSPL